MSYCHPAKHDRVVLKANCRTKISYVYGRIMVTLPTAANLDLTSCRCRDEKLPGQLLTLQMTKLGFTSEMDASPVH